MHLWSIDFQQGCQDNLMGERRVLSTNGAGKTGYPHEKNEFRPLIHITYKNELQMDQGPKYKTLRRNYKSKFSQLWIWQWILRSETKGTGNRKKVS